MPTFNGAGLLEGRRSNAPAFCRAVAEPGAAESSSCLPLPGRFGRMSSVDLPATSKLQRDTLRSVLDGEPPCCGVEVEASPG